MNTDKIYAEQLANEYAPKDTSKVVALRKLDQKANFATAEKMDKALLTLFEKKDFSYITVKEICEVAGVNRSTFYLHYETIGDLLSESAEYINKQFMDYMEKDNEAFIGKLQNCPMEKLYLITLEYLSPYLNYIKEHQNGQLK